MDLVVLGLYIIVIIKERILEVDALFVLPVVFEIYLNNLPLLASFLCFVFVVDAVR